jgi:hypothetical protein
VLFVPVIPPHHEPPSPRTRELAGLLGRVIEEYEKHHPSVTGREVRAALDLAARNSGTAMSENAKAIAIVSVCVLGFLAAGLAATLSDGGGMPDSLPVAAVAVGLLLVFGVLVLVKRLRGE